jgi:hypothetical protein
VKIWADDNCSHLLSAYTNAVNNRIHIPFYIYKHKRLNKIRGTYSYGLCLCVIDLLFRYGIIRKIKIFQTNIRFLGYIIHQSKISPISRFIQFADKIPGEILEKTQLQRFLGSLNYVADFYKNLRKKCKPLFDRLQKNPPS